MTIRIDRKERVRLNALAERRQQSVSAVVNDLLWEAINAREASEQ